MLVYVADAVWGDGAQLGSPPHVCMLTADLRAWWGHTGQKKMFDLYYTTDLFKTSALLQESGFDFALIQEYLFMSKLNADVRALPFCGLFSPAVARAVESVPVFTNGILGISASLVGALRH